MIVDVQALPFQDQNIEQIDAFLTRYEAALRVHADAFFSTALQSAELHHVADAARSGWRDPYLYARRIDLGASGQTGRQTALRGLASEPLNHTVAVGLAGHYVFYSEGVGRVRVMDINTMRVFGHVVQTLPIRPVDLFPSGEARTLAVTLEDGSVELIRLTFAGDELVASTAIANFSYLLPMFEDARLCWQGDWLWYQKDLATISCLRGDGAQGSTAALERPGEVSAMLTIDSGLLVACRTRGGTALHRVANGGAVCVRFISNGEITAACAGENGSCYIALSGDRLQHLDGDLNVVDEHVLPFKTYALCAYPGGVIAIDRQGSVVLWLAGGSVTCSKATQLVYANKAVFAADENDHLFAVTELAVSRLCFDWNIKHNRNIVAAALWQNQPVWVENTAEDQFSVCLGTREASVTSNGGNVKWVWQGDCALFFDSSLGYQEIKLPDMRVRMVPLSSGAVSVCAADGCAYGIGLDKWLHKLDTGEEILDLRDYYLSGTKLFSYGDILFLTGVSSSANASNAHTPHLLLGFRISQGHSFSKILERYYPENGGGIVFAAFSAQSGVLAVAFATPYQGMWSLPLTVLGGTPEAFVQNAEYKAEWDFNRNRVSMTVVGEDVLVCGGGMAHIYDIKTLELRASLAMAEGIAKVCAWDGRATLLQLENGEVALCEGIF